MPVPLPVIDRRTWDDLVAEARAMLPGLSPQWTEQNLSDPGITLVELFAWLTELLVFRADRVTDAQLRAYLRWLGIAPEPARPARTVLALAVPPGGPAVPLPGGLQVADPTSRLVFQADAPILVSPAWLELSDAESTARGAVWSVFGGSRTDRTADNGRHPFDALGPAPVPGDALLLGFDCVPAAPGEELSLYVWTEAWRTDGATRARLALPDPECPGPDWWLHYSARVAWEGWDGSAWQPVDVALDETRALTLTGPVRLRPGVLLPDPPDAPAPGRWWLRCRLVSGEYECPPRLAAIAVNAMDAAHAALVPPTEVLGASRGHADETYALSGRLGPDSAPQPVLAGTTRIHVAAEEWTEVSTFDRTGPADRHYLVDPATNAVRFGNGWVGRVPPVDAAVTAHGYRVGGGPAANLPARRLSLVLAGSAPGVGVHQPFDATGGTVAESLDAAHGRALDLLRAPARGVTVADWEALALDVPGVPVARAGAVPGYLPGLGCWAAPGVVTVVVLPRCGRPGPDFLAAVSARLRRHRPLTTELHVVGPRFVRVAVTATLHAANPPPGLAAAARSALDAFLDPWTGGPDGTGWPFGRDVLASDVLALLAGLDGVRYVDGLALAADGATATCDNLDLCPTDLVEPGDHLLSIVEDAR